MKRFRIQGSKKLPSRRYMSIKAATDDEPTLEDWEAEEEEYELNHADQEYDSAATSINSNKLPAIYRMISLPQGSVCVDFGGGRFDNAVEYIRDMGATLCVYDPYNRSAEHNKEVLKTLKANGGADAAINSNVLNVIKEPEARKAVLENIAKITKAGAPIYITVYEGTGKGDEGPTKSGYQLNRKTQDYLEEVQEVFPDAKRKGKLITAHNNTGITSSINTCNMGAAVKSNEFVSQYAGDPSVDLKPGEEVYWLEDGEIWRDCIGYIDKAYEMPVDQGYTNTVYDVRWGDSDESIGVDSWNLVRVSEADADEVFESTAIKSAFDETMQELHSELMARLKEVMTSPEMGFDARQSDDKYGAFWLDYCTIDIDQDNEYYRVEVRAEVSYEGMETIKEKLDPTLAGYDSDAYLDFDEPGIMSAWVNKDKAAASLQGVESATSAKNTPFSKSYNGYRIRLLNDGTGYAVFDSHGEMEEAGFRTIDDAKQFVDSLAQEFPVETSEDVEAAWYDVPDHDLDPPEYDEPEMEDAQETVEIPFDEIIHMDNQGSWTYEDESYEFAKPNYGRYWKSEDGVYLDDSVSMVEYIDELMEASLPAAAGDYRISGTANLVFDIELCKYFIHDNWAKETYDEVDIDQSNASFNFDESNIDNFKCKKIR